MSIQYVYVDLIFNYRLLGERMYQWRAEQGLKQSECDEMIDRDASWSEYERRRKWSHAARFETQITMRTLLNIVNLIDMSYDDVQALFILEKQGDYE
jgi:hypothetical protein